MLGISASEGKEVRVMVVCEKNLEHNKKIQVNYFLNSIWLFFFDLAILNYEVINLNMKMFLLYAHVNISFIFPNHIARSSANYNFTSLMKFHIAR